MWRALICLVSLLLPDAAFASLPIIISEATDKVGVTIYRDPSRGANPINILNPNSFAFISETRTMDLPPGPVTIRFEGVAGGIVPQSAIILGREQRERNRDAALLSQGGLVDAFTGQQAILRRTNTATGTITEERATIRSAADRMIVTTAEGSEAVYCSGLSQTLIYPNATTTLSAKPVLTMTTLDQPGGRVTVTLSYLATGFDWDANYVATLADDGKSIALFSWLTMVSNDETSFVDATTSAVAGRINRSSETRDDTGAELREEAESLDVRSACWPVGTTSTIGSVGPGPALDQNAFFARDSAEYEVVIVTASKRRDLRQYSAMAVTAVAESIGDVVLYRIPVPVTVSARSQKQVAFLADKTVKGELIYRMGVYRGRDLTGLEMLFRFTNNARSGLGTPLPAGNVTIYQATPQGRHLLGETPLENKTTDEEVELQFGEPQGVIVESDLENQGTRTRHEVRNENPFPIQFELEFFNESAASFLNLPGRLVSKPGKRVWSVVVPAYGKRSLTYTNS